jgi:hypothetical protein
MPWLGCSWGGGGGSGFKDKDPKSDAGRAARDALYQREDAMMRQNGGRLDTGRSGGADV